MRCDMPTRSSASCTRLLALRCGHVAVGERQFDVLIHGQIADQVEGLEDEADLTVADAGALRELHVLDLLAIQDIVAVGGVSSRPRIASSVDLPQPDGPEMETYSPRRIFR